MDTPATVFVGSGGSAGSGGSGSSGANIGGNGQNSYINSLVAIGGGGGGNSQVNSGKGADGGSGGGGSYDRPSVAYSSGVSGQGNRGGRSDRGGMEQVAVAVVLALLDLMLLHNTEEAREGYRNSVIHIRNCYLLRWWRRRWCKS